jgi:hypothetical protein
MFLAEKAVSKAGLLVLTHRADPIACAKLAIKVLTIVVSKWVKQADVKCHGSYDTYRSAIT